MTLQCLTTRAIRRRLALFVPLAVAGCVAGPPLSGSPRPVQTPPDTDVYFYPTQGRAVPSADQQDRDKYECSTWAVRQTGFDPSLPSVPPHQRVRVVAGDPPPGTGVAVGAVTGAVIGGVASHPGHTGSGTLIGALAGAAIGGIADAERTAQANANADDASTAALERRASNYRRAMTACLEGRGYSVR